TGAGRDDQLDTPLDRIGGTLPRDRQALPSDARGTPGRDRRRGMTARVAGETMLWLEGTQDLPLLREYLRATLECLLAPPAAPDEGGERLDGLPLAAYRRATCGRIDAAQLEAGRAAVPRFVEVALFQTRAQRDLFGSRQ